MKKFYTSLTLSLFLVWGFSIGVYKGRCMEEHTREGAVLSSVEEERVPSVGEEGLLAISSPAKELTREELRTIPEGCLAMYERLSQEGRDACVKNFKRKRKNLFVAYLLSIVGLDGFYTKADMSHTVVLIGITVIICKFIFFNDSPKGHMIVVVGGIFVAISWIIIWGRLPGEVASVNKKIFKKNVAEANR